MWKFKTIRLGSVFITGLLLLAWLAFLPGQADASFGEDSFAPFWNLQAQGPAPAQSQSAAGATELVSESGLRHRVASGETLWSLARYYHVDLSQLVSANKISDPARLAAGEELIIPGGRQSDSEQETSRGSGDVLPQSLLVLLAQQATEQPLHKIVNVAGAVSGIMGVESDGNPYCIFDNTTGKSYYFSGMNEYLTTGRQLLAAGHDIDMGAMQINSANGVSLQQAANREFAIRWAANYLLNLYEQTGGWYAAIRAYNGGPGGVNSPQTYAYLTRVLRRLEHTELSPVPSAAAEISPMAGIFAQEQATLTASDQGVA